MTFFKKLKSVFLLSLDFINDLLVPESNKIKGLLGLEPETLRLLLPRSRVNSENIFVLFDYKNKIVKLIVKSIKYKNNQSLKRIVAKYLYEEMIEISSDISLFDGNSPILVPMPMSKKEKTKRGFNQCEELCKEIKIIAGRGIEVSFNSLKKIRETERQTTLDKKARLLNVKNSMEAEEKIVKGKVVAVLDDVYTTGATMDEACRALYSAGAKKVFSMFIAH